jgi:hypothetical protein
MVLFWHRVAWQWGCSVSEAKSRMPASEIPGWIAYFQHEPVWPNLFRQMFAAFFAIVCNLLRNISNANTKTPIKTAWQPDDFLGTSKPIPPNSNELAAKMHILAARVNAAQKKRAR